MIVKTCENAGFINNEFNISKWRENICGNFFAIKKI